MNGPRDDLPRSNVFAPLVATVTAPVTRAVRRVVEAQMSGFQPVEVRCPRPGCGGLVATWSPLTRQLYDPRTGLPLGGSRERVTVRCDHCRGTRHASGRAVNRNRHNGRPLLA